MGYAHAYYTGNVLQAVERTEEKRRGKIGWEGRWNHRKRRENRRAWELHWEGLKEE